MGGPKPFASAILWFPISGELNFFHTVLKAASENHFFQSSKRNHFSGRFGFADVERSQRNTRSSRTELDYVGHLNGVKCGIDFQVDRRCRKVAKSLPDEADTDRV
ncbi:MAG: hypothetical protein AUF79_04115 [Crenarchaeota archaeon 13_1_20CM_2_51_8]|nr:MAG: hypothetical protein AUF79_04115 [Crenarchaeota archaeon 13_1_20CM_2_51_8]